MKQNDRDSAFPFNNPDHYADGMTLRDYFASKIEVKDLVLRVLQINKKFTPDIQEIIDLTASLKYSIADAMLKERER